VPGAWPSRAGAAEAFSGSARQGPAPPPRLGRGLRAERAALLAAGRTGARAAAKNGSKGTSRSAADTCADDRGDSLSERPRAADAPGGGEERGGGEWDAPAGQAGARGALEELRALKEEIAALEARRAAERRGTLPRKLLALRCGLGPRGADPAARFRARLRRRASSPFKAPANALRTSAPQVGKAPR